MNLRVTKILFIVCALIFSLSPLSIASEVDQTEKMFSLTDLSSVIMDVLSSADGKDIATIRAEVKQKKDNLEEKGSFNEENLKEKTVESVLVEASQNPDKVMAVAVILSDKSLNKFLENKENLKQQVINNMENMLNQSGTNPELIIQIIAQPSTDKALVRKYFLTASTDIDKLVLLNQMLNSKEIADKLRDDQDLVNQILANMVGVLNSSSDYEKVKNVLSNSAVDKEFLEAVVLSNSAELDKIDMVNYLLAQEGIKERLKDSQDILSQIEENMIVTLDNASDLEKVKNILGSPLMNKQVVEMLVLNNSSDIDRLVLANELLAENNIRGKLSEEVINSALDNMVVTLDNASDLEKVKNVLGSPLMNKQVVEMLVLNNSSDIDRLVLANELLAENNIRGKLSEEVINNALDNMVTVLDGTDDSEKVKNVLGSSAVDKKVLEKVLWDSFDKLNDRNRFISLLSDEAVNKNLEKNPDMLTSVLKSCLMTLQSQADSFDSKEFLSNPVMKKKMEIALQNDASMADLIKNVKLDKNAPIRFNEEDCRGFAMATLSNGNVTDLLTNENSDDVVVSFNPDSSRIKASFKTGNQSFTTDWNNTDEYQATIAKVDENNYLYANDIFEGILPADQKFKYLLTGKWKQKNDGVDGIWLVGRLSDTLPQEAKATYSGAVRGKVQNTNEIYDVKGILNLTADFGKKTLDGSFKNMAMTDSSGQIAKDGSGKAYNPWKAVLSGIWSANDITGDIHADNVLSTQIQNGEPKGGLSLDGNFNGAFFGPNGQEIGGNWRLGDADVKAKGVFAGSSQFSQNNQRDGEVWKGFAFGTVHRFKATSATNSSYSLSGLYVSNSVEDVQLTFKPSQGTVDGHIKVSGTMKSSTLYPGLNATDLSLDISNGSYYTSSKFKAGTFQEITDDYAQQKLGPKGNGFATDDKYLDTSFYHYLQAGVWGLHDEVGEDAKGKIGYQIGDNPIGSTAGQVVTNGTLNGATGWLVGSLTPDNQIPLEAKATYTGTLTGDYALGVYAYRVGGKVSLEADFATRKLNGDLSGIYRFDNNTALTSAHIVNGGWTGNNITGDLNADNGWQGQIRGAFFGPQAQELGGSWTLNGSNASLAGLFAAKSNEGGSAQVPKQGEVWNGFTAAVATSKVIMGKDETTEAKIREAKDELTQARALANKEFFKQYEDATKYKYRRTYELYNDGELLEKAEQIAGEEAQKLADNSYANRQAVVNAANEKFTESLQQLGVSQDDLVKKYQYVMAIGDSLDSVKMVFDPGSKSEETNRSIELNAAKNGENYNYFVQGSDPASKWTTPKDINVANWLGKVITLSDFTGEYLTGGIWYTRSQGSYDLGYEVLLTDPIASWWMAGKVTPDINIPTSGTAYYSGNVMGTMKDSQFNFSTIAGTCNLTADFAKRKLLGDFSMQNSPTSPWGATINASWQSGINKITGNISSSNGMNGNINAAFFGPNATEIGGNWNMSGADGSEAVGIFGAQGGNK